MKHNDPILYLTCVWVLTELKEQIPRLSARPTYIYSSIESLKLWLTLIHVEL